jgi:DNA primase
VPALGQDILKAIKERLSITDVVGDYLALSRRGRTYVGLCPFHDDHRPSLDVDPERQRYRCWACGAAGDVFSFVMAQEGLSFRAAVEKLAARAGVSLPDWGRRSRAEAVAEQLRQVAAWAEEQFVQAFWHERLGAPARQYMESRGFSPEVLRRFRIGFAPYSWDWLLQEAQRAGWKPELLVQAGLLKSQGPGHFYDAFRGRVMFPIGDVQGRTVAFGGRILPAWQTDEAAKYLNSPETPIFSKRSTLYGLHVAREDLSRRGSGAVRRVVVMEGYTDCLAAYQAGLRGVVGTLGTALTERHLELLRRFAEQVVLVFDGDEAGQKAADRALVLLARSELDFRVVVLPAGQDPADFLNNQGGEVFARLLEAAQDPLEFRLQRASELFDMTGTAGIRRALDYVLEPLVEGTSLGEGTLTPQQSLLLDRIASRLRLSYATVQGRWVELQRAGAHRGMRGSDPAVASQPQPMADPLEKELAALVLNWPQCLQFVVPQVPLVSLRTPWIQEVLKVCYSLWQRGEELSAEYVCWELDDSLLVQRVGELVELGFEIGQRSSAERWLKDILRRMEVRDLDREVQGLQKAWPEVAGNDEGELRLLERIYASRQAKEQRRPESV